MGPTVCDEDGPIPILRSSKQLIDIYIYKRNFYSIIQIKISS